MHISILFFFLPALNTNGFAAGATSQGRYWPSHTPELDPSSLPSAGEVWELVEHKGALSYTCELFLQQKEYTKVSESQNSRNPPAQNGEFKCYMSWRRAGSMQFLQRIFITDQALC